MHATARPMAFLGGTFSGTQRNWALYKNEAYATVQKFARMNYLFWNLQPVHFFTDHKNILYVFAPLALRPNSPTLAQSEVHRCPIQLLCFDFFMNHLEKANNLFANIFTRCSRGYRSVTAQRVAALYATLSQHETKYNEDQRKVRYRP